MNWIRFLGIMAAFISSTTFLPQVVRTFRLKKTDDISIFMCLFAVFGNILWIVYGKLINSFPIVLGNIFTLILSGSLLFFKIRY